MDSTIYADKNMLICDTSRMEKLFGIGDVIRKLRLTKAKMDLIPFAKLAGVNKTTLSKIENGGNCEIHTLEKIARALGMRPSELYSYLDAYEIGLQTETESKQPTGTTGGGMLSAKTGKRLGRR